MSSNISDIEKGDVNLNKEIQHFHEVEIVFLR